MLVSAGQPLFTEDTWLHLSMGRVYLVEGPWLGADPLLHTAAGPPAPAAWLFGVGLHGLWQLAGFQGLRIAHALAVVGILGLAWTLLRRASGSASFASLATSLFVVLAAYRLFQLRPHLFTIFATLLLIRLLIEPGGLPSWRRLALVTGLFALWVNLHAGFVLGLVLLGAAALGQALLAIPDPQQRPRAARLAAALGLAGLATLANPAGADPHLLYFAAGAETPALELVGDEWARVPLFVLPVPNVPPSRFAWTTVWALLLATPLVGLQLLHAQRRRLPLVALAAVSLVGMISAVRLLWLGVLPLLLLGRGVDAMARRAAFSWTAGVAAALAVPGFFLWGAWPMISRGVHPALYTPPYAASKQNTHAVWFLRDAGLEGNLWNDYASGNFLGYWLAPRLKVFVNGSLNVPLDVMEVRGAIHGRTGSGGASFTELLDRYRIDVFFGSGLPAHSTSGRPRSLTTTHLEGEPGWVPVYRSPRSAVYLRKNDRNAENLARVAAYYEREQVPFDPEVGFDPERVIEQTPRWAVGHGIAPLGFQQIRLAAGSLDPRARGAAEERLAELHALLGNYDRAARIDRRQSVRTPNPVPARRRLVWSLLHQHRVEESLEAAVGLETVASDELSRLLVASARRHAELPEAEAATLVAQVPLYPLRDARRTQAMFLAAEARVR